MFERLSGADIFSTWGMDVPAAHGHSVYKIHKVVILYTCILCVYEIFC